MITIDDVLSWDPCDNYSTREKLLAITGGRESLTPLEVVDLPIHAEDRLWVLLRTEVLGGGPLRLHAADCAEHVLSLWRYPKGCTWEPAHTIDVVRRYVRGEATDAELTIARNDTWVARDTIKITVNSPFGAAVRSASEASEIPTKVSYQAAMWAARAVAWNAEAAFTLQDTKAYDAGDAAWTTERAWQLERLRTYLTPPQENAPNANSNG